LLTTACWFIEASTVFVREIATGEVRPNFRQRRIVAFTAACCYAKSAPLALQYGDCSSDAHRTAWPETEIRFSGSRKNA
jgi:hypothetical protein